MDQVNRLQNRIDEIFNESQYNAEERRQEIIRQAEKSSRGQLKMKVVGSTGSSYRVVEPDVQEFFTRRQPRRKSKGGDHQNFEDQQYQEETEQQEPVHYTLGPPTYMNVKQHQQQTKGQLKGCISNCDIQPVGQGKKIGTEVQYTNPNNVVYGLYQNSF